MHSSSSRTACNSPGYSNATSPAPNSRPSKVTSPHEPERCRPASLSSVDLMTRSAPARVLLSACSSSVLPRQPKNHTGMKMPNELYLCVSQIVGMFPPSMTYSLPVIEEARSDARKATSSATSSGRFGRPSGIPPSECIRFCRAVVVSVFASFASRSINRVASQPWRSGAPEASAQDLFLRNDLAHVLHIVAPNVAQEFSTTA